MLIAETGAFADIYRCFKLYSLFSVLAFAVVSILQSAKAIHYTMNLFVMCTSLATSLNNLLTFLISFRLIAAHRALSQAGITSYTGQRLSYTNIVAILIESSLPFSILGILLCVALAKKLAPKDIFEAVWAIYAVSHPVVSGPPFRESKSIRVVIHRELHRF